VICYLGLGSNLGDRKDYINKAVSRLVSYPEIVLLKTSSIIETEPYGKTDQPFFLNCVMKIDTTLSAQKLLRLCLKTETNLGRIRNEKWGPRTIDIDILFYGTEIIEENDLIIPHPGIQERKFVLASLAELCPDLVHPVLNKRIKELNQQLELKEL
jgi:2-amino-4-hydroxy-6-hydroxymethyldihydropteridine diphosphokinase